MKTVSKLLASGSAIAALGMLLGSWAPFEFGSGDLRESISTYFAAAAERRRSRSDLVANTALGIPFAFLCTGFLYSLGASMVWRVVAIPLVLLISVVLSVACELPQGWLAGRVPSVLDTTAQLAGAAAGCVAWGIAGPGFAHALDRLVNAPRTTLRAQAAVSLAAISALLWSVLPGQVLVSPADYARKWKEGDLEWVPFTRSVDSFWEAAAAWGWSFGIGILLGLWSFQLLKRYCPRSLTPVGQWLVVLGLGCLPELLQVPIANRVASATDAIFSVAGAMLGFAAAGQFWREPNRCASRPTARAFHDPVVWFALSAIYLLLFCLFAWAPFQFVTHGPDIRSLLQEATASPFSDYRGSNLKLLFGVFRTAVLAAGMGLLAGVGAGMVGDRWIRRGLLFLLCLTAAGVSLGIEVGQLLENSRTGGGIGFISRMLGTWIGLAIGAVVIRGGSAAAATSTRVQVGAESLAMHGDGRSSIGEPSHRIRHYIPGMFGLRALGCLAVFGVHWQQMTEVGGSWHQLDFARLLQNGNTGVALFMMLSGFLLAVPLFAADPATGRTQAMSGYTRRRAARILPAYWVCLTALVVLTGHWRSLGDLLDALLHYVFLHNFSRQTLYSLSPPFWALAVIMQFYVLFGIVVWLLQRVGRVSNAAILNAFLFLAAVSQLLVAMMGMVEPNSVWARDWVGASAVCLQHSLASHLSIFSLGVVVAAIWAHDPGVRSGAYDFVALASAIGVLLLLATPLAEDLQWPGGRYHFPVVPMLLAVNLLAISRSVRCQRLLEIWPIRRLGIISYGFYLFHFPVMKAVNKLGQWQGALLTERPLLFAVISIAATIFICELSYRLLEKPLGDWLRRREAATPRC